MITRQNINTIYSKYSKLPTSPDQLDIKLLFEAASEYHGLYIDPDTNELVISSVDEKSPFHSIPLSKIHAIVPFEEWVAIVLHSTIIFLDRKSSRVSVDIRPLSMGFSDKLRNLFKYGA